MSYNICQADDHTIIIESLMLADKVNPLYVYLKQCFDKLKNYKFEIVTVENPDYDAANKFLSTSYFNGKKLSEGKFSCL